MITQKKLIIIIVLLILILSFFFSCRKEPFPQAKEVKDMILLAMDQIQDGEVEEGFDLILEAIILTSPHTNLPQEVESKVSEARRVLNTAGIQNKRFIQAIWEAYQTVNHDFKGFDETSQPSGTAAIVEVFVNKMMSALDQLKEGHPDKVVEKLLEGMIITSPRQIPEK